jgi:hypothetical protein
MSTSAQFIDPNDPRLTEALQEAYVHGPLRSHFAKKYYQLTGNLPRAERLDACGRFMDLRCRMGHIKREYQHCMDPFCTTCSVFLSHNTFDRWKPTLEFIESVTGVLPHDTLTFVEVICPLTRTRDAANDFLSAACGIVECGWVYLAGYKESSAVLRIVSLEPAVIESMERHVEQWVAKFSPKATVQVSVLPLNLLSKVFREQFLPPLDLSRDAYERAKQAALFAGMRRFRPQGIRRLTKSQELDLFADTNTPANISPQQIEELEHKPMRLRAQDPNICAQCGEKFIERSQWFGANDPQPRIGTYRWSPFT